MRGEWRATRRKCARSPPEFPRPRIGCRLGETPSREPSRIRFASIATLNAIFISSFTARTAFLLNCSFSTPTAYRRASMDAVFSTARMARKNAASNAWSRRSFDAEGDLRSVPFAPLT
jgi:hypothetical protein